MAKKFNDSNLSSQIFEYLKKTVNTLAHADPSASKLVPETQKSVPGSPSLLSNSLSQDPFVDQHKARIAVVAARAPLKRQVPLSPVPDTKRYKANYTQERNQNYEDFSQLNSTGKVFGKYNYPPSQPQQGYLTPGRKSGVANANHRISLLDSSFSQSLWILKHLKHTPLATREELLRILATLCNGIKDILELSDFNLTDRQYLRFLRIGETLFSTVRVYEQENARATLIHIHNNIEHLFDNLLDQLNHGDSKVEGKLRVYGFITGLMVCIKNAQIIKMFAEKLFLRMNTIVLKLWTACIFSNRTDFGKQLMDPSDMDLFYFYCQLLQAAITTVRWEPRDHDWMKETLYQALITLHEAAASLFALFPCMTYLFYSVILAVDQESGSVKNT